MTELRTALEEARRGLLDLSTRNRLLSLPKPGASRGVMILDDEDADFVLGALQAGRAFGFEASAAGRSHYGQAAPRAYHQGEGGRHYRR
jgi:hypothetical protein